MVAGDAVKRFVDLFVVWVTAGAALALFQPKSFTWFLEFKLVTPGLQLIMLGMGITLEFSDFQRVLRAPKPVLLGVLLQYLVMPSLGFCFGWWLELPPAFAAGLILVSCCPGGTASNVIAHLARADVALSVSMTAVSTLLAALMTPVLTAFLVGSQVEVDALGLFKNAAEVVVLPVVAGLGARRFFPRFTERVLPVAAPLAVLMIVLIVGAVLGAQKETVLDAGFRLVAAVFMTHGFGFLLGYLFGRWAQGPRVARTVSIEVGMQNSGLGVVLARNNFPDPLVAIPAAISAVFHCMMGSVLAGLWGSIRHRPNGAEVRPTGFGPHAPRGDA